MSYLQPLKDYLKKNPEEGLLEEGWSSTDIYLAQRELRSERNKKVIIIILSVVVVAAVAYFALADSGTAGSFFGFLSGKVISVQMHQDVINSTDFKYNFWIAAAFENPECTKASECTDKHGDSWGCIDAKCVDLRMYGG